ncbi:MAG: alpha/beta fold hydrolase [Bdellovibrionota bacterium]
MYPIKRRRVLALFGAVFFTLGLALIMIQERLIFFPEQISEQYTFKFKNFDEIFFDFEGQKMNSLLFPEDSSDIVLLYLHGNAGSLVGWGDVASKLRDELSVGVWIVDYPGYGKSEGSIQSERQLLAFTEHFLSVARKAFPQKNFVMYGRSIGSGPAAWVAAKYKLPLILETPYASFSKLASEHAPWFPSFLKRYTFETLKWLKNYKQPLLLIHGNQDEVIPVEHSHLLKEALPKSNFKEIVGGTHNNLSDFKDYWSSLRVFVNKLTPVDLRELSL